MKKGTLAGYPLSGLRVVVTGGASHLVDSSEYSFRMAAEGAMQQGEQMTSSPRYEVINESTF